MEVAELVLVVKEERECAENSLRLVVSCLVVGKVTLQLCCGIGEMSTVARARLVLFFVFFITVS